MKCWLQWESRQKGNVRGGESGNWTGTHSWREGRKERVREISLRIRRCRVIHEDIKLKQNKRRHAAFKKDGPVSRNKREDSKWEIQSELEKWRA